MNPVETGARVRSVRQKRNMNMTQLAALAGVTRDTVRHVETGKHPPQLETLRQIADALDVDVSVFMGATLDQPIDPANPDLTPAMHLTARERNLVQSLRANRIKDAVRHFNAIINGEPASFD